MPIPHTATVRVLVVDDDPAVREMLQAVLEFHGYEVTTAADGRGALARIAQQPPDVVLADLQMPDISGLQLRRHLAVEARPIPVIILTGALGQTATAADDVAAYLAKPCPVEHLLQTLARYSSGHARDEDPSGASGVPR